MGDEQNEQGSALHNPEDRSALELLAELQATETAAAEAAATEPPFDRCGTFGCVLRDRHRGLHVFADAGRRIRRRTNDADHTAAGGAPLLAPGWARAQDADAADAERAEEGDAGEDTGGEDAGERAAADHTADATPRRRGDFSCWTARGNWTLCGFTWLQTAPGDNGVSLLSRVRTCLVDNPWCWDIDFSDAPAPSSRWFHITPSTLTADQARHIAFKVRATMHHDWVGLQGTERQRRQELAPRQLPEAEQSREPLVWVQHVVYHWNMARGWCSYPQCPERDVPLKFYSPLGPRGEQRQADNNHSFSLQRQYNQYFHQWWNIRGVYHKRCNSMCNSHPFNGQDSTRETEDSVSEYTLPPDVAMGGPSAYFSDFHGGTSSPLPVLDPARGFRANAFRLRQWLAHEGFEHASHCSHRRFHAWRKKGGACPQADCPYGIKRVALIAQLGGVERLGTYRVG